MMNSEELIMNSEKYKCYAFGVGAELAFGKSEKLIMNSEKYKYDTNVVGAAWHVAQGSHTMRPLQINKQSAITLIALVITIIIMLILAGVVLNLTLGEHGIFKTAMDAGSEYEKTKIKEEIELAVLDIEHEEIALGNEITLEKIKEKLPGKLNNVTAELENNKITGEYKGYEYEIDNKFNVTIGKNNGTSINKGDIKLTLTISEELKIWLNATKETITWQDILPNETIQEIQGLIPTITANEIKARTEENGIVKYEDNTGGIISTNSESSSRPAYLAFNGIKDVENYTASKDGEAEHYWLEYAFQENVKAVYAIVRLATGSRIQGERTMKVQASNDGINWDNLTEEITHTGITFDFPEDTLFLNTNKSYKRFRIYITSIGNSQSGGADCSGAVTFQLYGVKTDTNINIGLSNAVNIDNLMEKMMHKKATEDVMLTNENIRNAVLSSSIALSKTKGLIPTITASDVERVEEDGIVKYTNKTTGGIISTNSEISSARPAYLAFNGVKDVESYTISKVGETEGYWLEYAFQENVKAIYAKVKLAHGSRIRGERTMKMQASSDGINWDDLTEEITYEGMTFDFPEATIPFSSNKSYKRFRILITSIGNSQSGAAECSGAHTFQLYGIEEK